MCEDPHTRMQQECIPQESAPALILVLNTVRLSPPQLETGNGDHRHPSLSLSLLPLAAASSQGLYLFAPLPPSCTDLAFVLPTPGSLPTYALGSHTCFAEVSSSLWHLAGVDLLSQTHTSSWVGGKEDSPFCFTKPGLRWSSILPMRSLYST